MKRLILMIKNKDGKMYEVPFTVDEGEVEEDHTIRKTIEWKNYSITLILDENYKLRSYTVKKKEGSP